MVEIEVKIRIEDPAVAREKILALGATVHRERHREENTLYDSPGGDLQRLGRALRVRVAGRKALLTLKGTARKSRSFKVREEFETEVKKPKELARILKALGFSPAFSYSKHRTLFKKKRLTICLDETRAGAFIELEGERHEIVTFARSLGYARKDFLTVSYVDLLAGPITRP
jgi:predicted adenylyl cyclase CyaB